MIKSMTGFGRYEEVSGERKISVEIKSVNHRYLDLNIRMPKKFNMLESNLRILLKEYIQRGKVDIFINYEDYTKEQLSLKYNQTIASEYVKYFKQMESELGIVNDMKTSTLARQPEVFTMEHAEEDEEELWNQLSFIFENAAKRFVESRELEGEKLKEDMISKLNLMLTLVEAIEKRTPEIITEYREKLEKKVKELLENACIEEGRIVTEVAIMADKVCVDEEIVRLKSHIESTKREIMQGGSIGRKLDFIAQELNREANTILSKTNDIGLADYAIELKTEIEKVREQIQNIE